MSYRIAHTEIFSRDFKNLSKKEQSQVRKYEFELSKNPFAGKPLGFKFLREKRINKKRIYYLIYKDHVVVLMVAISDKKTQQATIDTIKSLFKELSKEITKLPKFKD